MLSSTIRRAIADGDEHVAMQDHAAAHYRYRYTRWNQWWDWWQVFAIACACNGHQSSSSDTFVEVLAHRFRRPRR